MPEQVITFGFYALIVLIPFGLYLWRVRRKEAAAAEAVRKGQVYSEGPRAQHPHIDTTFCIGCQSCTSVCPEGHVLAMVGGKAAIVNAYKCVGHGLCAEACPVGAIQLVMASPRMSANLPYITEEFETSVPNLFIVGELGGLALIKNAVNQGREAIDTITERLSKLQSSQPSSELYDVVIVGAGPAGISASLRAIEQKLNYLTLEKDSIGGEVAKYPRQKLVMTSPVEFPMYGKFKKLELSKENLLAFWNTVLERADFKARTHEPVEAIKRREDGIFSIRTSKAEYSARAVVLAIGRAGTPRKLGVSGEELPKVMYRLIEADHYINKAVLVVGGGDSAIEAAMGLAHQPGNAVTLSYRKDSFYRIKERNAQRIQEMMSAGKINVVFNSVPVEIRKDSVVLDVKGTLQEVPNDFVWIFAGGVASNEFLKQIGVTFGTRDLTADAQRESLAIAS